MIKHLLNKTVKRLSVCLMSLAVATLLATPLNVAAQKEISPYGAVLNSSLSTAKKFSGEELRRLHPTELVKALRIADPTIGATKSDQGDNPNATKDFMLRQPIGSMIESIIVGPLVILDGYEISMERLTNMDINRVKSISVLRDAQSLAMFGIKGGNGVVYVESYEPTAEKLNITYSFNGAFSFADLSTYDMMNTNQKLDYEKKLGLYDSPQGQILLAEREQIQNSGKYWLKEATKMSFVHKHNLTVEGQEGAVGYKLDLVAAPKSKGVLIGSERESYGVGAQLNYNYKNISIFNDLRINTATGSENPNVALIDFAVANPYWKDKNDAGFYNPVFGQGTFNEQFSPFNESNIGNIYKESSKNFTNRFGVSIELLDGLSLSGEFVFSKDMLKVDKFESHLSYKYYDWDEDEQPKKGRYAIRREQETYLEERVALGYQKNFGDHSLTATAALQASDTKTYRDNYASVGFPNINMSYISFGKSYDFDMLPGGSQYRNRMISGYGYVGYNFAEKYMAEATFRWDKATELAPNRRNATFYSVALGWDVKKEEWLKDSKAINALSIKASLGTSGVVPFDYSFTHDMYDYRGYPYLNISGSDALGLPAFTLKSIGNPDLKWITQTSRDIYLQSSLFNRVSLGFKYYNTKASGMLTVVPQPSVMGNSVKVANGGYTKNQGFEFYVSGNIINSSEASLSVFASGMHNKTKIGGYGDYATNIVNMLVDKDAKQNYINGLLPYTMTEGGSLTAIYAVESKGIDPETGERIYINKDGQETTVWDAKDLKVCGDMQPDLVGNFGVSGSYRNWSANVVFKYTLGADTYNTKEAFFIENGSFYGNMPIDAANSWFAPGDNAKYANPLGDYTYANSQFVQRNNTLSLASFNVSYTLPETVAQKAYMKDAKVGITCANMFYKGFVDNFRGVAYPYTRSVILSLSATF